MKAVYLVLAVLAAAAQVYTQCIPSCAPGPVYAPNCGCPAPALVAAPAPAIVAPSCGCPAPALIAAPTPAYVAAPATVVTTNSVAANLADTLSLLTVTSLLAETLPYGYPAVAAPVGYPGCGCGYGYML